MANDDKGISGFWGLRVGERAAGGLLLALALAVLFGFFVKLLWNWVMPGIFGLGAITYGQAFALVLLSRMFFGGWGQITRGLPEGVRFHAGDIAPGELGLGASAGAGRRRIRYSDWWRDEGKAAFDAYIERKESER